MITERHLRDNAILIKALTGLPADSFWELVKRAEVRLPGYEYESHSWLGRQRAVGGGRNFAQPLVIRIVQLLTYLRLHIPQQTVAYLFGGTQTDISRDLRRLLPLIKEIVPVPQIWEKVEEGKELTESDVLGLEQLADGRLLVDATEQDVYRSQDNDERKKYYSGKQKEFTIKTQIVTDGDHHIKAISECVPGAKNDKKLSDEVETIKRAPQGCEVDADKGYQGLANQVSTVTVRDELTGEEKHIPVMTVNTPFKKPKGKELTEEQKAFNRQLGSIRVRVEHCIGWVKNWAIIATRFRCALSIYTPIMQIVCGLVNWQTDRWQALRAVAVT